VTYLNVVEVESALAGLAAAYPTLCKLISLPNPTIEGRGTHALQIGDVSADAVLFTGCAHAREWGGAEICIYFAADLLEAYTARTGVVYGGKSFSASTVRRIVDNLNVVVFPCVNPDGRAFDQLHDALWRKNRNPASSGGDPNRVGVDINRNHDFLWDFRTDFAPGAMSTGTLASDDPVSDLFHGTAAESEPETRNVRWLLDTYRFTRWYVDIHSYTGDLLYSWGDDLNQSDDTTMNFRNPGWNGQRGVPGGYAEYIPAADLTTAQGAAQRVVDAINAVHSGHYVSLQSVSLWGSPGAVTYPTSGASDDYAYSRHFADCIKGRVLAFTLEFGYAASDFRTSFHPPWADMQQIVLEIDAGMFELCAAAAPSFRWPWFVLFRRLWPWQIWDPMTRFLDAFVRQILGAIRSRAQGSQGSQR
jgi:murein tripeptide amidase MpaA